MSDDELNRYAKILYTEEKIEEMRNNNEKITEEMDRVFEHIESLPPSNIKKKDELTMKIFFLMKLESESIKKEICGMMNKKKVHFETSRNEHHYF